MAYVFSNKEAKDVEVITSWGGGQNDILQKCPTTVAYSAENKFAEDRYAFEVEAGDVACRWTKLLLDKSAKISEFDDPLLEQYLGSSMFRLPPGKTAIDVTSSILAWLYNHALTCLKDEMGVEAINQVPISWVLTVPATWTLAARQATLDAAMQAGFDERPRDSISLVDEPEAGAIACMRSTIASFDEKQAFQVR